MTNVHKQDLRFLVKRLKTYPDKATMVDLAMDCDCTIATVKNYIKSLRPELVKGAPHRIPYDVWASSQLSIVKHYGGCTINGKRYELDYDNAPRKIIDGEEKFFPDLVEVVGKPKVKLKSKKNEQEKHS